MEKVVLLLCSSIASRTTSSRPCLSKPIRGASMRFVALLGAVVLALTPVSLTSTMKRASMRDLTVASNTIVVGKVSAVESRWVGKKILTYNTISVSQVLKGAPSATFAVTTLGGRVGAISQTVPSSPRLRVGQEVLLFTGTAQGHNVVVFMDQGLFAVVTDSGKKYVLANPQALGLALSTETGRVPLDSFVGEIARGL